MFLIWKNKWLQKKTALAPHKSLGEPLLGTTDNSSAIVWICVWCVCLESGWVKGLLMTGWGSFLPWTNDCQCWDNAVAPTTPHFIFHIAVTAFGQDRRFNLGMQCGSIFVRSLRQWILSGKKIFNERKNIVERNFLHLIFVYYDIYCNQSSKRTENYQEQ